MFSRIIVALLLATATVHVSAAPLHYRDSADAEASASAPAAGAKAGPSVECLLKRASVDSGLAATKVTLREAQDLITDDTAAQQVSDVLANILTAQEGIALNGATTIRAAASGEAADPAQIQETREKIGKAFGDIGKGVEAIQCPDEGAMRLVTIAQNQFLQVQKTSAEVQEQC